MHAGLCGDLLRLLSAINADAVEVTLEKSGWRAALATPHEVGHPSSLIQPHNLLNRPFALREPPQLCPFDLVQVQMPPPIPLASPEEAAPAVHKSQRLVQVDPRRTRLHHDLHRGSRGGI